MTPTSVFQLGRMRQIDLLAAYFEVCGGHHGSSHVDPMGQASPGALVKAILAAT